MDISSIVNHDSLESPARKRGPAAEASDLAMGKACTKDSLVSITETYHGAPPDAHVDKSPWLAKSRQDNLNPSHFVRPTRTAPAPDLMTGGPVLSPYTELQRHPYLPSDSQVRPLRTEPLGPDPMHQAPPSSDTAPPRRATKRKAPSCPPSDEDEIAAKKQSNWTQEEDNLVIKLRGEGLKWKGVAKALPGRSDISCRLRYQNYLEKRADWNEDLSVKLSRLYHRHMEKMWQELATEMRIPWRVAEAKHWELGQEGLSARANAPMFRFDPSATSTPSGFATQDNDDPAEAPSLPLSSSNAITLRPVYSPAPVSQHDTNLMLHPQELTGPLCQRADSESSRGPRKGDYMTDGRATTLSTPSALPPPSKPLPRMEVSSAWGWSGDAEAVTRTEMGPDIRYEGCSGVELDQQWAAGDATGAYTVILDVNSRRRAVEGQTWVGAEKRIKKEFGDTKQPITLSSSLSGYGARGVALVCT